MKSSPRPPENRGRLRAAADFLRQHYAGGLFFIAAAAFALRLGVCAQLAHLPTVIRPDVVTDMATYRRLALKILTTGHWPTQPFDYQPFYYAVLLPLAWLLGPVGSPWPVFLMQALLGAATVWLAGDSAARLFGRPAGWLAALLLALSRFHIFYTPFLLLEVSLAFWIALLCDSALRCLDRRAHWGWTILAGAALSCALLTRGSALLLLPGLAALLAWRHWRDKRRLALHAALFALAFLLPILPFVVHNSRLARRLTGPSVAGPKVLVLGNTPEAPAGGLEYPRSYHRWLDDASQGRESIPRHLWRWFREEPLIFLEQQFRKLLLFWDRYEIPNNVYIGSHVRHSSILRAPLLPWGVIGTLGLAGLLLAAWSRRRARLLLTWLLVANWLSVSAFYLLARFRIASLPLLAIAGAGAIALAWRQCRRADHRQQRLAVLLLVFLFSGYCVFAAAGLYQEICVPAFFRHARPNGLVLRAPGETVIYDHAPLCSKITILGVPPEGLAITKRFITPAVPGAPQGKPVRQRILLYYACQMRLPDKDSNPETLHPQVLRSLRCTFQGKPLARPPKFLFERGMQWLAFDFHAPLPDPGQEAEFTFHLALMPIVPVASAFLSSERDYGRTDFQYTGKAPIPAPGEAVAEWLVFP